MPNIKRTSGRLLMNCVLKSGMCPECGAGLVWDNEDKTSCSCKKCDFFCDCCERSEEIVEELA